MASPAPVPPRRGRLLRFAVAVVVSLGALGWFVAGVDWGPLGTTLANVKLPWVGAACAILVFEFVLRAVRWRVLLRPLGVEARVGDLFAAQVVGAAANTLFPLRAGEVAKPLVAAERTGRPFVEIVATTVMERVFDLFGMVSVLVAMVLVLPTVADGPEGELVANLQLYGGAFGAIALLCLGLFFVLASGDARARQTFATILRLGPPPVRPMFMGLFDGFVSGLGSARDLGALTRAGALSVWMWFDGALAIWCLFQAFSMDLPFGAACFTAVAIALTVAIPQAPGFLGVFHKAMEMTMVLWGQSDAAAQGFAIVFWAVSFAPITLIGVVAMWREGLSPARLSGLPASPAGVSASSAASSSASAGDAPTTADPATEP